MLFSRTGIPRMILKPQIQDPEGILSIFMAL